MKRTIALAAASVLAATGLVGCSQEQQDQAADTAAEATSAVAEGAQDAGEAAQDAASDVNQAGEDQSAAKEEDALAGFAGPEPQEGVPSEVTGYTQYAQGELENEGVTADQVVEAVQAAANEDPNAQVEWDEDGYWEIEFSDIDVDIRPDGVVHEVDN